MPNDTPAAAAAPTLRDAKADLISLLHDVANGKTNLPRDHANGLYWAISQPGGAAGSVSVSGSYVPKNS